MVLGVIRFRIYGRVCMQSSFKGVISIATLDGEAKESPSTTAFYCFLIGALSIIVDVMALIVMTNTHFYKVLDRMQQVIVTRYGIIINVVHY